MKKSAKKKREGTFALESSDHTKLKELNPPCGQKYWDRGGRGRTIRHHGNMLASSLILVNRAEKRAEGKRNPAEHWETPVPDLPPGSGRVSPRARRQFLKAAVPTLPAQQGAFSRSPH